MVVVLAVPPGLIAGAVTAVAFRNTISTGFILLSVLAALGTIVGLIYGIKWKTAFQVERATRESIEERGRVLAHERDDITSKLDRSTRALVDANKTIARLEALPNLERVLQLVNDSLQRFLDRQEAMHAENVALGAQRTKQLLEAIQTARPTI